MGIIVPPIHRWKPTVRLLLHRVYLPREHYPVCVCPLSIDAEDYILAEKIVDLDKNLGYFPENTIRYVCVYVVIGVDVCSLTVK